MAKHPDVDNVMVVEGTMRNLPSPTPFCVEFDYPIFKLRDDVEAKPQRRQRGERPNKPGPEDVLAELKKVKAMTQREWQEASTALGLTIREFEGIVAELRGRGKIYLSRGPEGQALWKAEEDQ